ncbi:MAG TPA: VCBS repeat-containing protein, partial [Saprospiraceae bacterium]|nr:VCBS repeat-containing protein [Saprospiraceae bacterium]
MRFLIDRYMYVKCAALLACICVCLIACHTSEPDSIADKPLFVRVKSEDTGINFRNSVQNTQELNIFNYRNFYNGGGVAIGDIDNDNLPDIYFTDNLGQDALYRNRGGFRFEDITQKAGVGGRNRWSTGVVMVDVNADGWLDIYVCKAGYLKGDDRQNELYINNGDLTFTERAEEYGLNEAGYTTHAAFFDYDSDGDLDCYILKNSFIPVNTLNYSGKRELRAEDWPVPDFLKGGGARFLRNDGGSFTDVTMEAGIYSSLIGFGLGVTVGDINGDNLPDMYISNDFFERDYLYINKGDGTFSEEIKNWIQHLSLSSMGADMADINNDGYPEIFVTDMLPDDEYRLKTTSSFETYAVYELKLERDFYHQYMQNTLQLNNKNHSFSEIAYFSGVAASDWSWGALLFDMDNDGFRDIYICNGIYQDVTDQDFIDFFANEIIQRMVLTGEKEELDSVLKYMPSNPVVNKAFRNLGNLKFEDRGVSWGFDEPSFSNGAAYGDLDNDGDLDLVVNNLNQECFIYQNLAEHSGNHYLKIRLVGTAPNVFAVGAKVTAYAGNAIHYTEVIPSRGFQSSVDYPVLFGLGTVQRIDSVVIIWPDRSSTVIANPPLDSALVIRYTDVVKRPVRIFQPESQSQKYLTRVNQKFEIPVEDHFVDFYHEGLIVKKLSKEGPAMSMGDVDKDGDSDLFIGGPANQLAHIYLQQNGVFAPQEKTGLEREQDFEDVCSTFFDADGDGDLDLIVGSGGNASDPGSRPLQDRVYMNDGTGHFVLSPSALPNNGYNTGAVLPLDFDQDGDIDLLVGSRSIPFNYGVSPPSYVYQNDGKGKFADVTDAIAPEIRRLGMITDIAAADLDGDKNPEVIFTGEWMAPTVFAIKNGKFIKTDSGLEHYSGWWYTIETTDVDNDGDQDLVMGNRGENFYYRTSPEAPAKLWLADFDENGTIENIVTRTIDRKDMPLALKREITEQVVSLKKKNLRHSEYATKSIQEL